MAKPMSLTQAVYLARTGKSGKLRRAARALRYMQAEGHHAQTVAALANDIPADLPGSRDFDVDEFVAAMYVVRDGVYVPTVG